MERNKEKTKEKILDALRRILSRQGFRDIGINTIAREAGCDKVLIYRYFGGLDGLLRECAARQSYLPGIEMLSSEGNSTKHQEGIPDPRALSKAFLIQFGRVLRSDTMTREILAWELMERNELTDAIADEREKRGLELLKHFPEDDRYDLPAVAAILSAGITYLVLRGKTADCYNGIELNSDAGWQRIEKSTEFIVDTLYNALENEEKS